MTAAKHLETARGIVDQWWISQCGVRPSKGTAVDHDLIRLEESITAALERAEKDARAEGREKGLQVCNESRNGHVGHIDALKAVKWWIAERCGDPDVPLPRGIGTLEDVIDRALRIAGKEEK